MQHNGELYTAMASNMKRTEEQKKKHNEKKKSFFIFLIEHK